MKGREIKIEKIYYILFRHKLGLIHRKLFQTKHNHM